MTGTKLPLDFCGFYSYILFTPLNEGRFMRRS